MATRTCRSALAVLLGMFIVGCGGESDRATSTTDVATTVAPPNLTQYLLQPDEVPGLKPMASPQTDSGPPFDPLPEDGAERLERSGDVSTTYQPAQGERIGGVSSVLLFEAEAGARDWMAYETSDEALRTRCPARRSSGSRFPTFRAPTDGRDRTSTATRSARSTGPRAAA